MLLLMMLLASPVKADVPVKEDLVELIKIHANEAGVDQATALAIVEQESNFRPNVKRFEPKFKTYSVGLFQMFYPTARSMGFKGSVKQLQDVQTNIKLGIEHLKACTERFGKNHKLVVCCHNAGVAVEVSFCRNYAWTARYVKEVMAKRQKWSKLLAPEGRILACAM